MSTNSYSRKNNEYVISLTEPLIFCSDYLLHMSLPQIIVRYVSLPDTFHINPQLHLLLSDMEEVVVSLNQHAVIEPKVCFNLY